MLQTLAVRSFTAGKMRGERLEHNGILVWNDCYNSNPEAARSMLDLLGETRAARRIAVLGEMLELGSASARLRRRRQWRRSDFGRAGAVRPFEAPLREAPQDDEFVGALSRV